MSSVGKVDVDGKCTEETGFIFFFFFFLRPVLLFCLLTMLRKSETVQIHSAVVAMLVICIYKALWRWHFRYFTVAGATTPAV